MVFIFMKTLVSLLSAEMMNLQSVVSSNSDEQTQWIFE